MPQNDKIIVDVTTGRSLNKKTLQDLSKILYKYDKQLGNGTNVQQLELLKDLQSVWPNPPAWSNLSNGELMIES